MYKSLLAHVVFRSNAPVENCATEALAYILRTSPSVSANFTSLFRDAGLPLPSNVVYNTQRQLPSGATPDLYCSDDSGTAALLIENKFEACLTPHQPDSYLDHGRQSDNLIVLFLVPEHRRDCIWSELRDNSAKIGNSKPERFGQLAIAQVNEHRWIVVLSWMDLLTALQSQSDKDVIFGAAADLRQLEGLVTAMQDEAFLPLDTKELADGHIPRRMVNFTDLCIRVYEAARERNLFDDLKDAAGGKTYWGKYVKIGGFDCWVGWSADYWLKFGDSPIWFEFIDRHQYPEARSILQDRIKFLMDEHQGHKVLLVRIELAVDAPRQKVIEGIVEQLTTLSQVLRTHSDKHALAAAANKT